MDEIPYKKSLRLQRAPFPSRADNTFFHAYPPLVQRLQTLKLLFQGRDALTLVIGERGSGKTTLMNQFLAIVDENWHVCRIQAQPKMDAGHLLKRMARCFGIPFSESLAVLKYLNNYLAFCLKTDQLAIVMIDDAHQLAMTELKFLLRLAAAPGRARKPLHIALFGEDQIKATLEQITDRVSHPIVINTLYMPPLTQEQTRAYLRHRLAVAGFKGKGPFSSTQVKAVHQTSMGLPGLINQEAHKLLEQNYSSRRQAAISFWSYPLHNIRPTYLVTGGIVAICLFAALFFHSRINLADKTMVAHPQVDGEKQILETHMVRLPIVPRSRPETKEERSPMATTQMTPLRPPIPESEKKTGAVRGAPSKPEGRGRTIHRESWLLAQKPSYYTLQILGTREVKSISEFLEAHQLQGPAAYYRTYYKSTEWYPLLYGVYATYEEASEALKDLPLSVRISSPWIRRLSSVQRAIRRGRE